MDFSPIELTEDDERFVEHAREFLGSRVTDELLRHDRETGDNFNEELHLALGANGYLHGEFYSEEEGGFSRMRRRLWNLEKRRVHMPWVTAGTTALVAQSVHKFAAKDLWDEVMPGVLRGEIRLCLGYTEPEGGSDIATCKTRAVRDGAGWIINGSKMFTTGAHNCQYVFLITNTDPDARKHKSLTMFLVPLDTPGIEIQGLKTVDGDRTNIVYYTDVRVDDKYRLGDVNGGWAVLQEPLAVEHGAGANHTDGLDDIAVMIDQGALFAEACDRVAREASTRDTSGRALIDDEAVAYRLGRTIARTEAMLSTPGMFGRVAIAQTMRDCAPELMDILGVAATLPKDVEGAVDDGGAEYMYRFAPLVGIYGGTLEVFRNMIAQYMLGLGKPSYATTATTKES